MSGYIVPAPLAPQPTYDTVLAGQIQALVVGITGLAGNYVRPRWQALPPNQPPATTSWCAVGVTVEEPDDYPALGQQDQQVQFQRHETLEVFASFYGPNAQSNAALWRDGLYIAQNLTQGQGLYLLEVQRTITASEEIAAQIVPRYDVTARLRREVVRTYPSPSILISTTEVMFNNGVTVTATAVNPPIQ